ncbi:MAG: acetylglutamate kinase [Polyangiaceae bacterium]
MSPPIVVKLGGGAIAEADQIAPDLKSLRDRGEALIVVHGGGAQTSELQRALGDEPRRIAGRRVTDEAALEALKMAVGGKLNIDICSTLLAAGASPIGLNGSSALLIEAVRRPPRVIHGAGDEPIDLGLVGDVKQINLGLIEGLLEAKHIPVIACIGADANGTIYNINADVVATQLAIACGARALVLVSDIVGVLRDPTDPASRIGSLDHDGARALIEEGVVTGGMIPKLDEAFKALKRGIGQIHIVGKLAPGDLQREIETPGHVGTVLTR